MGGALEGPFPSFSFLLSHHLVGIALVKFLQLSPFQVFFLASVVARVGFSRKC